MEITVEAQPATAPKNEAVQRAIEDALGARFDKVLPRLHLRVT
jgi:hypothetical protein